MSEFLPPLPKPQRNTRELRSEPQKEDVLSSVGRHWSSAEVNCARDPLAPDRPLGVVELARDDGCSRGIDGYALTQGVHEPLRGLSVTLGPKVRTRARIRGNESVGV